MTTKFPDETAATEIYIHIQTYIHIHQKKLYEQSNICAAFSSEL